MIPGADTWLGHGDPQRPSVTTLISAAACRAIESTCRAGPSRSTHRHLTQCLAALRANRLEDALRHIDRVWRVSLDESAELVWIYGLLLTLEGRDHDATLGLLQRAKTPDADVLALLSRTLLRLDRVEEARQILESALADFCIVPGGLLEHVASEILEHPTNRAAGWIGRAANLEFTGRLVGAEPIKILQVRLNTGAAFLQPVRTSLQYGHPTFHFKLPTIAAQAILEVSSRGLALLGGGCPSHAPLRS